MAATGCACVWWVPLVLETICCALINLRYIRGWCSKCFLKYFLSGHLKVMVRPCCGNYSRCITMCSSFFFLSGPLHCVGRSSRSSNGVERTQKTCFPLQKLYCDLQTKARHKDRHLQLHLQEHHEGLSTSSSHKAILCQLELHFYIQLGHSSNPSELFLCFKKSLKHK